MVTWAEVIVRIALKQSGVFSRAIDRVVPAGGSRVLHLEAIRVIAILLVVFNHTSTRGFLLFSATDNLGLYVVYLGLSILCKIAVPLFFMVSGALLIPRDESIRTLFRRRVLRMVIVIVLFMLAMWAYNVHEGVAEVDLLVFLKMLYSSPGKVATAYWFLYAYLAILLMLPFVRPLARGLNDRGYAYLMILQVFFAGVVPVFGYLAVFDRPYLSLPLFGDFAGAFFFFVMGYFVEHRLSERVYRPRSIYLAVAASFAAIYVSGAMTWLRFRARGGAPDNLEFFFNGFIAIPTLSAYFLVKYALRGRSVAPWTGRLVLWLGATAFGTYLLDSALRPNIAFIFDGLQPYLGSLLACLVWVLCVVVAGSVATTILKLVPGLDRLL